MGANLFQNRGDDRTFYKQDLNSPFFDYSLDVNPKNDVGFLAALRLGYVFGTGIVRPTIEGDFFYNGFRGGADFNLKDPFVTVVAERDLTTGSTPARLWGTSFLRFNWEIHHACGLAISRSPGAELVESPVTEAQNEVPINARC